MSYVYVSQQLPPPVLLRYAVASNSTFDPYLITATSGPFGVVASIQTYSWRYDQDPGWTSVKNYMTILPNNQTPNSLIGTIGDNQALGGYDQDNNICSI